MDDVMAVRELPHVVAADGDASSTRGQFRVGDVSVKYEGKKVAGTILEAHTAQVADVNEHDPAAGPHVYRRGRPASRHRWCVLGHDTCGGAIWRPEKIRSARK